jgi:hypothetical protein
MAGQIDPRYESTYKLLHDRCGASYSRQYYSAIAIAGDADIPRRFSMAAHELRELISRLHEVSTVSAVTQDSRGHGQISESVRELAKPWEKAWDVKDWNVKVWKASVDWDVACSKARVKAVLARVHRIIADARQLPVPSELLINAAPGFDPSPIKADKSAYEIGIRELLKMRRYFIDVAHDQGDTDEVAFRDGLERLSVTLREVFAGTALDELIEIDEIVKAVENGE